MKKIRNNAEKIYYLLKTSKLLKKKNIKIILSIFSTLILIVVIVSLFYHEHSFGNSEIIKLPTCASEGLERRYCSSCDATEERYINKLPHKNGKWQIDQNTNLRVLKCIECGAIMQQEALSEHTHIWGEWITVQETSCEESGIKERHCQCGAIDTLNFAYTGHTFSDWQTKTESTCTAPGVLERICHCGMSETQQIPQLEHNKGDFIIVDNEKQYHCTNCGTIIEKEFILISEGLLIKEGVVIGMGSCTDEDIVISSHFDGVPVTEIGYKAFSYSSITSMVIPDTVTKISEKAFYNSPFLETVHLGNSITQIGKQAFSNCDKLTIIVLPTSITQIDDRAFAYCTNLRTIIYLGTETQWNEIIKESNWLQGVQEYTIIYN